MSSANSEPLSNCPSCRGAGESDSGGVNPQGTAINVPRECLLRPDTPELLISVAFITIYKNLKDDTLYAGFDDGVGYVGEATNEELEKLFEVLKSHYEPDNT